MMWALVNPAFTRLFQCTDRRMWVNTLQCIKLESETSYNRLKSQTSFGLKSQISFIDHDLHVRKRMGLKRMGLKTSLRGSRIPEMLNTRPNRTLLEGEKTGRKRSGCVWQDENSVRQ